MNFLILIFFCSYDWNLGSYLRNRGGEKFHRKAARNQTELGIAWEISTVEIRDRAGPRSV